MKLRVGLVGLGDAWESRHRPALRALFDRFDVRAVCTDVAALADNAAREFNAQAVDGFRVLAARPDVDAVLVLEPQWYGALPILAACDYGKAVYCASILELDPARASDLRQRVERSGVAFMAEFARRQSPSTLRLKELIATHLGAPRLLFCHQRLASPAGGNGKPISALDTNHKLLELVDWCCYVIGQRPASVIGVGHESDGVEDYAMMSLEFPSLEPAGGGTLAQISCGRYFPASWHEASSFRRPSGMQVCCERGVAFVDPPTSLVWFDAAGRHHESLESDLSTGEQLLTQFHRAVTSLVRKTNDLQDAYDMLNIVAAARTSSQTGQRILLNQ